MEYPCDTEQCAALVINCYLKGSHIFRVPVAIAESLFPAMALNDAAYADSSVTLVNAKHEIVGRLPAIEGNSVHAY